jgi:D-sedoheptulose 7-phosphate isomerase
MDSIIRQHVREAAAVLHQLDEQRLASIRAAAQMVIDCLGRGGTVYVCGNGGSAADAQHIAAEMAGRFLRDRPALACIALTTDTSNLTAIGNDYGYDHVFVRQVQALVRPGDLLWILSTSGRSPNVVEAARAARVAGAKVLAFTGGSGGHLTDLVDACFKAPAEKSYLIQQAHQVAYHAICDVVEQQAEQLATRRGG